MESIHAVNVLNDSLTRFGGHESVKIDQSSQFAAEVFVNMVLISGAKISMDVRGARRNSVFVEIVRLSVKYE